MLDYMLNTDWQPSVYRVNWLKAKSRAERWQEEHELLTSEMEWVLRFFDFKEDEAKAWALITGKDSPGHTAYARKKGEMWRLLAVHAEKMFSTTKQSVQK